MIIPDADKPGHDHAADVARSCYGKAARIRVLELPDAKDVSEWLDNGHTAEELTQLVSRCSDFEQPKPDKDINGNRQYNRSDAGNAE